MLIEKLVIEHLMQKLDTDNIYAETPEVIPDKAVLIRVEDRGKVNHIDAVTLEISAEADSKIEAAELDHDVRMAMEALIEHSEVSSCKLGGGRDDNDGTLKKYRYVSYHNVIYYDD